MLKQTRKHKRARDVEYDYDDEDDVSDIEIDEAEDEEAPPTSEEEANKENYGRAAQSVSMRSHPGIVGEVVSLIIPI